VKNKRLLLAIGLTSVGVSAHAAIIPSSVSYSAYSNLIETIGNSVLDSQGNNGTALAGGTVSANNSGTRSDAGVTTAHLGASTITQAVTPFSLSATGSSSSKTTYLSGGNSFQGQGTVSGFGARIDFTVDSSDLYEVNLTGVINTFHRAYEPFGPAGAFFNYLRLIENGNNFLIFSQSFNSATLANIPFSTTLTLNPGVNYRLEFETASSGVTVNFADSNAGPGAYGETGYNIGYSLAVVPEPGTISVLGLGMLFALRRTRRIASR
jgi:hypothetical protein